MYDLTNVLHTCEVVVWVLALRLLILYTPTELALITVNSVNINETSIGNCSGICIIHQHFGDPGFARAPRTGVVRLLAAQVGGHLATEMLEVPKVVLSRPALPAARVAGVFLGTLGLSNVENHSMLHLKTDPLLT